MNKMKYLLLLAICAIATGTMTSCLDSEDDSSDYTFTPEELSAYLTRISGTYQGKLMYYRYCGQNKAGEDSLKLDSIENMSWRINRDSTIVIANFPDSIYHNSIRGNVDFRKVLSKAPSQKLECTYAPYKGKTQNGAIDYWFQTLPDGKTENNRRYVENKYSVDGKEYSVNYGYVLQDYNYASTGYMNNSGYMEILYIMNDIKCSEAESFTVPQSMYVLLKGNKLY